LEIVYERLEAVIDQLRLQGESVDGASPLIISTILEKLPSGVNLEIENQKGDANKIWNSKDLMNTIREYLRRRENLSQLQLRSSGYPTGQGNHGNRGYSSTRTQDYPRRSGAGLAATAPTFHHSELEELHMFAASFERREFPPKRCIYCKKEGSHYSDDCKVLSSAKTRNDLIKQEKRCAICLRFGHQKGGQDCGTKYRRCFYCNQTGHHRSLCQRRDNLQSKSSIPRSQRGMTSAKNRNNKRGGQTQTSKQRTVTHLTTVPQGSDSEQSQDENNDNDDPERSKEPSMVVYKAVSKAKEDAPPESLIQMWTAYVPIRNPRNNKVESARVFIDSGSGKSFVTLEFADKINLQKEDVEYLNIQTFNSTRIKKFKSALVTCQAILINGEHMDLVMNTIDKISNPFTQPTVDEATRRLLEQQNLAHPIFKRPTEFSPDILLGADYFATILLGKTTKVNENYRLIPTTFGKILTKTKNNSLSEPTTHMNVIHIMTATTVMSKPVDKVIWTNPNLEGDIQNFWELENIGITDNLDSTEDEEALLHFQKNVQFKNGRYQVGWPWKQHLCLETELHPNKSQAYIRFLSLTRRLFRAPDLLEKYNDIMQEQKDLGIIEKVDVREPSQNLQYYIPHHPILTPQKQTTKLRIVYDASAKGTKDSLSLNESMHRGMIALPEVAATLINIRTNPFLVTADIEKAFLQVEIKESDRDVLRFYWLKDVNNHTAEDNVQVYRFVRMPFGVIASPFLLEATIRHHLIAQQTAIAKIIEQSLYVDNLLIGANTTMECNKIYSASKEIFQKANMRLREYNSNNEVFKKQIKSEDLDEEIIIKVLGMTWDTNKDLLSYVFKGLEADLENYSKRTILSKVATIFDPLGLLAPLVLPAKLVIQSLWEANKTWDQKVVDHDQLQNFKDSMENIKRNLEKISVPRYIGEINNYPKK
jgi:hypothetical protein